MDIYWDCIREEAERRRAERACALNKPMGEKKPMTDPKPRRKYVKEYRNEWVCPKCTTAVKSDSNRCRYCGFIVPDRCEKCNEMSIGSVDYPTGSGTTDPLKRLTKHDLWRSEYDLWMPEGKPLLDGLWKYIGKYLCKKCHPGSRARGGPGFGTFVGLQPTPLDFERMMAFADSDAERARFEFLAKDAERTERAYKYLTDEMKAVVKAAKEDPAIVELTDGIKAAKDAKDPIKVQDLQKQVSEALTGAVYKALSHLDSPHRLVYEADAFEIRIRKAIRGAIAAQIRTWYKKPPTRGQGIVELIEDVNFKVAELAGDVFMAAAILVDAEAEHSTPEVRQAIRNMDRLGAEIETLKALIVGETDDSVRALMNEDLTRLQGRYFEVCQIVERLPALLPLEQKLARLSENLTLKYEPLLDVLNNIYPKYGPDGYARNIETPVPVDQAMDTMRRLKAEAVRLGELLKRETNEVKKAEFERELELIAASEQHVWSSVRPQKAEPYAPAPIVLHPYTSALIESEKTTVIPDPCNPMTWPSAPNASKRCESCDSAMEMGTLKGVPAIPVYDREHGTQKLQFKSAEEIAKYTKDELGVFAKMSFLLCGKCATTPDLMAHLDEMWRKRTEFKEAEQRKIDRAEAERKASEQDDKQRLKDWHNDVAKCLEEAVEIVRREDPVYAASVSSVTSTKFEWAVIAAFRGDAPTFGDVIVGRAGQERVPVITVKPEQFQAAYFYHWLGPQRRRLWKTEAKMHGWAFTAGGLSKAATGEVLATEVDRMIEMMAPCLLASKADAIRISLKQAGAGYREKSSQLVRLKSPKNQRETKYDLRTGGRMYKSERLILRSIEMQSLECDLAKDETKLLKRLHAKLVRRADALTLGVYDLPIEYWEGFWRAGGDENRIPVKFIADDRFKGAPRHKTAKMTLEMVEAIRRDLPERKPSQKAASLIPVIPPVACELEIPAARRLKGVVPRDFGYKIHTAAEDEDKKPRCFAHPHPEFIVVTHKTGSPTQARIDRPSVDECKRLHRNMLDRVVTYRGYLMAKAEGRTMQVSILGAASVEKDFEGIRQSLEEASKVYPDIKVPVLPPPRKPKTLRLHKH